MINEHTPTVLTIAGFDPYGGAGIQADIKTIHALHGYAFSVTTALTAQNSQGVSLVEAVDASTFQIQLETLLSDVQVDAVKIGMLANIEIIAVIVEMIKKYKLKNIVLDTVLVSSSGKQLLELDAIEAMVQYLFPLCKIITPNIPEMNSLLNAKFTSTKTESSKIANALFRLGVDTILLKGGHSIDTEATDCLVTSSGIDYFSSPRVETTHTHGTGCILSSAIAIYLANKLPLNESVKRAKLFLYKKLLHAQQLKFRYKTINQIKQESIF
ncbi:MAG: bifunctional hydroxymethylpyrimidine kinase/phosphomethylpyrimidine kinase [Sulfurovum sp.]|nr:bifunctional hydroxymethylpyrimidine kinase/phosphomethylpyrimidine kinase [Sulfurovum sp.]